jgi:hypothetical protein
MLRLNGSSNLSHVDVALFGLAYAALIFTVGYYATGLHDAFSTGFAIEDGPVEWTTAVCLLLSSLVLIRNAGALYRRRSGSLAVAMTLLYAIAFFFAAGEEISWGYRVFELEASEFFRNNNVQGETNIHNLVIGEVKLVKTIFGSGLTFAILVYLLLLPVAYVWSASLARLINKAAVPLADTRHILLALTATLVISFIQLTYKWEVYELVFSLISASIFLQPRNQKMVT